LKLAYFKYLFYFIICIFISCKKSRNNENTSIKNNDHNNAKTTIAHEIKKAEIPLKVYKIRDYVKKYGKSIDGYVGGRKFKNLEKRLPILNKKGKKINYQEWDVNPRKKGKNRGKERLVTGSDDVDYYTNDHYQSFITLE
jgi:ribonuclease T1